MEKIFLKSLNIKNRGIYTLKLCQLFILSTMFVSISYAQTNVIDGHEYVDMGLPSGTLWQPATSELSLPQTSETTSHGERQSRKRNTPMRITNSLKDTKRFPELPIICYARISEKTSAGRYTMQQG